MDDSDAVVLAGQHGVVVHVSGHVGHNYVVDSIFGYEVCSILSIVVEVVDVFAAGPNASVLHRYVLNALSQRGCQFEELFSFLS